MEKIPEPWMRGTQTTGLAPILQPIVDTWTAVIEEIEKAVIGCSEERLWERPADCASVGFHIQHIAGVIDRLLTYAEGKPLSEIQFAKLRSETVPAIDLSIAQLIQELKKQIHTGTNRLRAFNEAELTQPRKVGRAGLPSTVIGLCFHAAEHAMRHTGQLLVTAQVIRAGKS